MTAIGEHLVHEQGVVAHWDEVDAFREIDLLPLLLGAGGGAHMRALPFAREELTLHPLCKDFPAKPQKVFEITRENPTRPLSQPVNPFRTDALHPHWSAFDG